MGTCAGLNWWIASVCDVPSSNHPPWLVGGNCVQPFQKPLAVLFG